MTARSPLSLRNMIWIIGLTVLSLLPVRAWAFDYQPTLTEWFEEYEKSLDKYLDSLLDSDWDKAVQVAQQLNRLSQEMLRFAAEDKAGNWRPYASNLVHHTDEMILVTDARDRKTSIYLASTLLNHMGEIQAANPMWLRQYIANQIFILENAIRAKDRVRARDAAEIIHTSANKIALSAGFQRAVYRHTRWLSSINIVNRLGDAIIGKVNADDWTEVPEMLEHIKHTIAKWEESFHGPKVKSQVRP